jgi:acylphosphatase
MRMTVLELAERHGLTGWVCNLPDRRVEFVAEGPRAEIEEFLTELRREMLSYIRDVNASWGSATGEWDSFRITHD